MMNFPFDQQRTIDLICMGRVAVDFYAEQIYSPLSSAQSFRCYLGGCAGNIAVGTARQGLRSAMFSCVGTDDMGQFLLQTLQKEGVDTTLLTQTADYLTGLVVLGVNPPDRFPLIFYRENCADMQIKPEHCDAQFFKRAKAILLTGTGLSTEAMRKTSRRAVELAQQCKTAIIIDLDYRPVLWGLTAKGEGESRYQASQQVTEHYQKILPQCDLVVGTEEEVLIAGGGSDFHQALNNIRQLTDAPIVLKRGEQGCAIYADDIEQAITGQSYAVDVLNVLGAGDAFMSGFLSGWLREKSWETCAQYANACGAMVVTRHGCAPAIPNFTEMQYFIEHYASDADILSSRQIKRLHRRSTVGNPADEQLLILAYDHRWQFEKSAKEAGKSIKLISQFKQAVFSGFCKVKQASNNDQLAILVDPIFAEEVLKAASDQAITIGAPIEAAGVMPLTWLSDKPLYEELLTRPKTWFVKVLFNYHPDMDGDLKALQINQLKQLNQVCDALERKLMLELILPKAYAQSAEAVVSSIQDIYQQDIYPYWWKIAALEDKVQWQSVCQTIKNYDEDTRIIMLGGASKQINTYETQFKLAKATGMVNGFAIGRSIFWQPWCDLIADKITIDEVADIIAERYTKIISIWQSIGE